MSDIVEHLHAKIDAMNAAAASLKGACACRFDENDRPITECTLHAEMRSEIERLRAEVANLAPDVALLRSVLSAIVVWADRHGKDPDWLDSACNAVKDTQP